MVVMKDSDSVLFVVVVLITVFISCGISEGAVMWSTEPCPPGINPGEEWFPEDLGCTRCACFSLERQPGFSCATCGVAAMLLSRQECYADKTSPEENYPECCRVQEFCPGHERYNASKAGITVKTAAVLEILEFSTTTMRAWGCCGFVALTTAILWWCGTSNGAVFWSSDPCPANIKPGESWIPSDMYCAKCLCASTGTMTGYECQTCGVAAIPLSSAACYIDNDKPEAAYPQCCDLKEFCPGNARYNASKAGTGGIVG